MALRFAHGSATVAIITAAGIIAPIGKVLPNYRPEVMYVALCCGGTALPHAGTLLVLIRLTKQCNNRQ